MKMFDFGSKWIFQHKIQKMYFDIFEEGSILYMNEKFLTSIETSSKSLKVAPGAQFSLLVVLIFKP